MRGNSGGSRRGVNPIAVIGGVMLFAGLIMMTILIRMEVHLTAMDIAQHSAAKLQEDGLVAAASDVKDQVFQVLQRHKANVQKGASHRVLAFQHLSESVMRRIANFLEPTSANRFAGFNKTTPLPHICAVASGRPDKGVELGLEQNLLSLLSQDYPEIDIFVLNTAKPETHIDFELEMHSYFDRFADPRLHLSPSLSPSDVGGNSHTKLQHELLRLTSLASSYNNEQNDKNINNNNNNDNNNKKIPCAYFLLTDYSWLYLRRFLRRVETELVSGAADIIDVNYVATDAIEGTVRMYDPNAQEISSHALLVGSGLARREWVKYLLDNDPFVFRRMEEMVPLQKGEELRKQPLVHTIKEPLAVTQS